MRRRALRSAVLVIPTSALRKLFIFPVQSLLSFSFFTSRKSNFNLPFRFRGHSLNLSLLFGFPVRPHKLVRRYRNKDCRNGKVDPVYRQQSKGTYEDSNSLEYYC